MTNKIKLFNFHNHVLRFFLDKNGEPWFIAKDVAEILEYRDAYEMLFELKMPSGIIMDLKQIIKMLQVLGNPKINFSIYWNSGVLTVRFVIDGGNATTYDLLTARGDKKGFKTLHAVLVDLKNIDPGLNQDSKINFYYVE